MSGEELLSYLGIRIYKKPLSNIRQQSNWPNLNSPLHVAVLLIDFDTEVCMNGILGFLENSTGAYFNQTIDACNLIGAKTTAQTMQQIHDTMAKHKISHHRLREPHKNTTEYQITSFAELHGSQLKTFANEVCEIAHRLYIYDSLKQSPWPSLEGYLAEHKAAILAEIEQIEKKPVHDSVE